jgi:hypothetical protein
MVVLSAFAPAKLHKATLSLIFLESMFMIDAWFQNLGICTK